eukprot:7490296-Prorocentrum_lima.AAC.1
MKEHWQLYSWVCKAAEKSRQWRQMVSRSCCQQICSWVVFQVCQEVDFEHIPGRVSQRCREAFR